VFFGQRRIRRDDQPCRVFKFPSMYVDADKRKDEVATLNLHGGGNDHGMFEIKVTRASCALAASFAAIRSMSFRSCSTPCAGR
jgi:hypothetical protein